MSETVKFEGLEVAVDDICSLVDRLRYRLKRIAEIIELVDRRCMAADGPVLATKDEITAEEIIEIYKLASRPYERKALGYYDHAGKPKCWHKEIDDEGICKACGAKAAIKLEGLPALSDLWRSALDMHTDGLCEDQSVKKNKIDETS